MPEARSVTLGAWVRVGGRDEPAELSGASHFLEHLLFKGTDERSAREIAESIDAVGGEMNAFTAREHTAYYARLPHQHLDLGLDLLGDVLTSPALRPDDVDAERQVIVEEILMNLDSPEDRAHTLLAEALFPEHPLGRDVLGDMRSVEALGRDEIAGFFERWYRPGALVLAAAGRLDHAAVVAGAEAAFGAPAGGTPPERIRTGDPSRPAPSSSATTPSRPTCASGWRSPSTDDPDRWALAVANQVLGGGMASRLFQEVREERGLAYAVYSHPSAYTRHRLSHRLLRHRPQAGRGDARGDRRRGGRPGRRRRHRPELEVAIGYLEGSLLLGLEDSGGRMGRLGRSVVQEGRATTVDEQVAAITAVTRDDVHRVLRRVFDGPAGSRRRRPTRGIRTRLTTLNQICVRHAHVVMGRAPRSRS